MNALFPFLSLETGTISRKVERGKHTTRHVELYYVAEQDECESECVIADTPGFSMIDFVRFDFFDKDDLPHTFREFAPYIGACKYRGCTHMGEEGCAIVSATSRGEISQSRYDSFTEIYMDIKDKHPWYNKMP